MKSVMTGPFALALLAACAPQFTPPQDQPMLGVHSAPLINADGLTFKDLNRNGVLDVYEDWRQSPEMRAADLTMRMTLAEKAGAMVHGTLPGTDENYDLDTTRGLITDRGVTSFITRLAAQPGQFAKESNAVQEIAEGGRLGVPVTISTDPRHHFAETFGASVANSGFSQWPEAPGLAAADDADMVRRFGDIARQEYRAVGIHMALSPQADLATEPRWPRIDGTFGEDPARAGRMVGAYVQGFQGSPDGLTADGVIAVVKHWVGYGAAANQGFDAHNHYGRFSALTGDSLALHIRPFEDAFAAGVGGVMPTYAILQGVTEDGAPFEQVGAGFHRWLLTDLLRGRYGYDGLILSDWAITNDCTRACVEGSSADDVAAIAMPWGVEDLTRTERFARGVQAGLDQFGGVTDPSPLIEAVELGLIEEARLDDSVRRIMSLKFRLGLFENPYVDPDGAAAIVGNAAFMAQGLEAQRRSIVLLRNEGDVLPLASGARVWLDGVEHDAAIAAGLTPAASPEDADAVVVRVTTPYQSLHPDYFFGAIHHEGDLDFAPGQADFDRLAALPADVPVIVAVHLDRPAVLTALLPHVDGLLGVFGASDDALLSVVTGAQKPQARLPFELPSSMDAVRAQRPDLPHDSLNPLFPYGVGETY